MLLDKAREVPQVGTAVKYKKITFIIQRGTPQQSRKSGPAGEHTGPTRLRAADAAGARFTLITTNGVFPMDTYIARLDQICDLADSCDALLHFDDCHATGSPWEGDS